MRWLLIENEGSDENPKVSVSVTSAILEKVFDVIEADADLAEVAPALRHVVLHDQVFSEAAIRAVLLPEVP